MRTDTADLPGLDDVASNLAAAGVPAAGLQRSARRCGRRRAIRLTARSRAQRPRPCSQAGPALSSRCSPGWSAGRPRANVLRSAGGENAALTAGRRSPASRWPGTGSDDVDHLQFVQERPGGTDPGPFCAVCGTQKPAYTPRARRRVFGGGDARGHGRREVSAEHGCLRRLQVVERPQPGGEQGVRQRRWPVDDLRERAAAAADQQCCAEREPTHHRPECATRRIGTAGSLSAARPAQRSDARAGTHARPGDSCRAGPARQTRPEPRAPRTRPAGPARQQAARSRDQPKPG